MKRKITGFWKILKATSKKWYADDPFRQSAVIAYYAIFSLPALLVLIVNVMGFIFEKDAINGEISRQVEGAMGSDTAKQVEEMVTKAGDTKAGLLPSIIAIITILLGATGVFIQLQKSLNHIMEVQEKPDLGFLKQLKSRLFSFGLILSIGFLLLISLVISSMLAAFSHWLQDRFPDVITYLFFVIEFAISLSVISLLFALMFKILPDVKIPWKNIWVGAILTGVLFIIGKYALSIYFGQAEPGSIYGAAGSIILLLLWASYSSMIVFFGAEFTKQYIIYHGSKIRPTKDAEKISNTTNTDQNKSKGDKIKIPDKEEKESEQHVKEETFF